MAQDITLLGANYSAVPSVLLPKTGGGTAQFDDTSIASNAAAASDINSGKLAWVNGALLVGTGSGGGGTGGVTQDQDGFIVLDDQGGGTAITPLNVTQNGTYTAPSGQAYSPVTVNVSGGGGGWEKIYTFDNIVCSTTSTSEISVETIDISDIANYEDKIIYFCLRDKAGKRDNYFYGTDAYYYRRSNAYNPQFRCTFKSNANGQMFGYGSQTYGVYLSGWTNGTNNAIVAAKYSSIYSSTIDGTYKLDIYVGNYPTAEGNPLLL